MKTDSFTFFNKYKADIYIIRLYRKVVDFARRSVLMMSSARKDINYEKVRDYYQT